MNTDVLIIGAGIMGCALARVLSRYQCTVTVVERAGDVAEGASKANSGIVHAGFDAHTGSQKAIYNVKGAEMYPSLCQELDVPYKQTGAYVLAFREEDRETLAMLQTQGEENGVKGLRILERDELLQREPEVNPEVVCALYAPTSGITSPYEMTYALADHAAVNGVTFLFNTRVTGIDRTSAGWQVQTPEGEISCKILVNCAGIGAGEIHTWMTGGSTIHLTPRRGQYYLLDRLGELPFHATMFQCPTNMGKGVLISPTVHGNLILGPTAEDIQDPIDTATTQEGLRMVMEKCRLTWPNVSLRSVITNFSGIRAHEDLGDFVIGGVGQPGGYVAAGIESPGLTASPAIAEDLGETIADQEHLEKKISYAPPYHRPKPFFSMTQQEREAAVAADSNYGRMVCRCEVVTEAEVRAAIHRPVGATTIDGVKRRTRAGMGRCQGGFCSTRVTEILAEELHIPMTQVTKMGGNSLLLTGTLEEAMKEGMQS